MKITVTQVTEIEVSAENAALLIENLHWYKRNGVRLNMGTLSIFDASVTNFETHIVRHTTTIADLEKSGEI